MTNAPKFLQSLIIYSICLPLALFLGYQIAAPADWTTLGGIGVVLLVLITPILLRYHHVLLVFAWNTSIVLFLLPGPPRLWMSAVALSLLVSVVTRALVQSYRFISVPELSRPMIFLFAVVLFTAEVRGGIGLRALGSQTHGGQRYFSLFAALLGYFAFTAKRIPSQRVSLYVALFFLSGLTYAIGDLFPLSSGWARYFFLIFPPSLGGSSVELGVTRFNGLPLACSACVSFMLATYGIRDILTFRRLGRLAFFLFFFCASLTGGYRSMLISLTLIFAVQFCLEGLHHTRLILVVALAAIMVAPLSLVFVQHLPWTFQRALAFVPGIPIDPVVRQDAEFSSEWRTTMWRNVIPDIPKYLIVGKGYGIDPREMAAVTQVGQRGTTETAEAATIAGDYHNGPLGVIIPFGLGGVAAFLWLVIAGYRVLYRNHLYGDPQLRTVNTFLLASYTAYLMMFLLVGASLPLDIPRFVGILGFSVSLNGRVRQPVRAPAGAKPVPAAVRAPIRPLAGFSQ